MNKIRVFIGMGSADSLEHVQKLLSYSTNIRIIGDNFSDREIMDTVLTAQPDIVLLDMYLPAADGLKLAAEIAKAAPYMGIILTGPSQSIETLKKVMHAGAGDFLQTPLKAKELIRTITSLNRIKQAQRKYFMDNSLILNHKQPKVISVFSSKGGVGKTVVATNVAVALQELTGGDIMLMDMDLQFGDITDLLNLAPKTSIIDLLEDKDNIEENELGKYLTPHYSGIKVLAAPQQPEQADLVDKDDVNKLIMMFMKTFDYIVVDLPPMFNEVVLEMINLSSSILLVTTMEIPTLKNIRGGMEVLQKLGCPREKINLIINRFNEKSIIRKNDVIGFLDIKEIFCVEDNPDLVAASINAGEPLVLQYKKQSIAEQFFLIGKSLIELGYKRKPKKKLLARLFKRG